MSARLSSRLTLIFLVACFYLGVVTMNDQLFFWAADTSYRHWFYPPAGVRLFLIMLLGWPAVLGYFIAVFCAQLLSVGPQVDGLLAVTTGAAADALSLWFGLYVYGRLTGVKHPWDRLTWHHVPFLALFVSVCRSVVSEGVRHIQGTEILDNIGEVIRNMSLYAIGDTLGTIMVLLILIRVRRSYRHYIWEKLGGLSRGSTFGNARGDESSKNVC